MSDDIDPQPPGGGPEEPTGGLVHRAGRETFPQGNAEFASSVTGVGTTVVAWPPDGPPPSPGVHRGGPPPPRPPAPPTTAWPPLPGPPLRSRQRTALAGAIADALLAQPDAWGPDDMLARAAVTFDGQQDWLPDLLEQVLDYYPRPPADRPRELGRVVDVLLAAVFDRLYAETDPYPLLVLGHADPGPDPALLVDSELAAGGAPLVEEGPDWPVTVVPPEDVPGFEMGGHSWTAYGGAKVEDNPEVVEDSDAEEDRSADNDDRADDDWGDDGWGDDDEEDAEDADQAPSRPRVVIPRPVRRLVAPTRTVRQPFSTPRLDHAGDLAALLGLDIDQLIALADTRLRGRRARSPRIANYRYQWLERPSGPRLLEAPRPRLLAAQRVLLHEMLDLIPTHTAVHGFVAGRSVVTGAREHVGADTVLTLDLEHFFAAVTAGRIWGVLRSAGLPEPVAHLLAGLTTTATPVRVLSAMPHGPDPDRQFRLRHRLAVPHLPQGAPTSPALANLVAFGLDRRLSAYAGAVGLTYTRYADDLTFSGTFRHEAHVRSFARAVERIVADENFRINEAKTRWRGRHERQTVTGVVVNDHPAIARDEIDRLRAVLHDCRRSGPAAANRHGHPDFRAHLLGRISWVASVHPARGARLREQFDGVDWANAAAPTDAG